MDRERTESTQGDADRSRAGREIPGERENLAALVHVLPEPLVVADLSGRILYESPMADVLFGYGPGELRRLCVEDLHPAEYRDEVWAFFTAMVADRQCRCELPIRRRDGTRVPVEIRVAHGVWDGQKVLVAVMHDLTQHLAVEAVRRTNEDRYWRLFETISDGVFILDRNLRFVAANSAIARSTGMPKERLIGHSLEDLFPDIQASSFLPACRCVLETRQVEVVTDEVHWDNGRRRWYEVHVHPVSEGILCVSHDVTDRHRLERMQREAEENFRAMAESSRDAVLVVGDDDRPVYANGRTGEMAGRPMDEVLGIPIGEWLEPANPEGWSAQWVNLKEDKPFLHHHEARIRLKKGEAFPVEAGINRTSWDRKPAVMLEIRDISWRRRLQEQVVDASTWERQNLARVLHDGVAQQVSATAFLCRAIETQLAAASRPEADQVRRMADLLQDGQSQLRGLSRVLLPSFEAEGLADGLARLAETLKTLFGVECSLHHPGSSRLVSGDVATHAYYIAQEAAMNAVRHGSARRITITVGPGGKGRIRLCIEDDGCGFDLKAERKDAFGLNLIRYRAERMGGRLTLRSKIGEGTRVTCTFPVGASA